MRIRRSAWATLVLCALVSGGCVSPFAAKPKHGGIAFEVSAERRWQPTPITLEPDDLVEIYYLSGHWNAHPRSATEAYGAEGNPAFLAAAGFALPGAPEGALIGRVAGRVFHLGSHGLVPRGLTGRLELIINSDLRAANGFMFEENTGAVTVEILTH